MFVFSFHLGASDRGVAKGRRGPLALSFRMAIFQCATFSQLFFWRVEVLQPLTNPSNLSQLVAPSQYRHSSLKPVAHDAFFRAGFAVWRRSGCRAGFSSGNFWLPCWFSKIEHVVLPCGFGSIPKGINQSESLVWVTTRWRHPGDWATSHCRTAFWELSLKAASTVCELRWFYPGVLTRPLRCRRNLAILGLPIFRRCPRLMQLCVWCRASSYRC